MVEESVSVETESVVDEMVAVAVGSLFGRPDSVIPLVKDKTEVDGFLEKPESVVAVFTAKLLLLSEIVLIEVVVVEVKSLLDKLVETESLVNDAVVESMTGGTVSLLNELISLVLAPLVEVESDLVEAVRAVKAEAGVDGFIAVVNGSVTVEIECLLGEPVSVDEPNPETPDSSVLDLNSLKLELLDSDCIVVVIGILEGAMPVFDEAMVELLMAFEAELLLAIPVSVQPASLVKEGTSVDA